MFFRENPYVCQILPWAGHPKTANLRGLWRLLSWLGSGLGPPGAWFFFFPPMITQGALLDICPIAIPPSACYSWMPDLLMFSREHSKPWEYLSPSSLAAQESVVGFSRECVLWQKEGPLPPVAFISWPGPLRGSAECLGLSLPFPMCSPSSCWGFKSPPPLQCRLWPFPSRDWEQSWLALNWRGSYPSLVTLVPSP